MALNFGKLTSNSIFNGLSGNLNELSADALQKEYGAYLMAGETIQTGFKLIRDAIVITDKRILDFDRQGATGTKQRVKSIRLSSIVEVEAETAGFGLDDSELTITYIVSPYYRANEVQLEKKTFEFPKKYNIQGLYTMLTEIAESNVDAINK
ncbi:MAG: hypothetical protein DBX91_14245 [Subdoligranulum variabile]|nr:MAG: hypothetical protein DBX91_14245 [Subdoligranulum variabile]